MYVDVHRLYPVTALTAVPIRNEFPWLYYETAGKGPVFLI